MQIIAWCVRRLIKFQVLSKYCVIIKCMWFYIKNQIYVYNMVFFFFLVLQILTERRFNLITDLLANKLMLI